MWFNLELSICIYNGLILFLKGDLFNFVPFIAQNI